MIYKRCSTCGRRIEAGKRCEDCAKRFIRNKNRYYNKNKRNRETQAFYNSPLWERTRNQAMERFDHIDVFKFVISGLIIPASVVHHIVPLDEDKDLATDEYNLIPLSAPSHYEVHRAYDLGTEDKQRMQERLRYCISEYRKKF